MRRHFRWDKKYLYWGVTAFLVVAASILFFMALRYFSVFGGAVRTLARILSPFIWGLVFTYLLAPLMRSLEKHCFCPLGKKLYKTNEQRAARFGRSLSVLVSIIVLIAVLTALVYMILPQLYSSIETIVTNSPAYLENLGVWVEQTLKDFPAVANFFEERLSELNSNLGVALAAGQVQIAAGGGITGHDHAVAARCGGRIAGSTDHAGMGLQAGDDQGVHVPPQLPQQIGINPQRQLAGQGRAAPAQEPDEKAGRTAHETGQEDPDGFHEYSFLISIIPP